MDNPVCVLDSQYQRTFAYSIGQQVFTEFPLCVMGGGGVRQSGGGVGEGVGGEGDRKLHRPEMESELSRKQARF